MSCVLNSPQPGRTATWVRCDLTPPAPPGAGANGLRPRGGRSHTTGGAFPGVFRSAGAGWWLVLPAAVGDGGEVGGRQPGGEDGPGSGDGDVGFPAGAVGGAAPGQDQAGVDEVAGGADPDLAAGFIRHQRAGGHGLRSAVPR